MKNKMLVVGMLLAAGGQLGAQELWLQQRIAMCALAEQLRLNICPPYAQHAPDSYNSCMDLAKQLDKTWACPGAPQVPDPVWRPEERRR